jgi:hypothetical protein|tara:strand:+ start:1910 stop:2341 length:432 start_codon:yes stop_codon:yes gene_type:complete
MGTRKKRTIAQEVDMAAKLLQRYVRLKSSDDNGYCHCVTCGKLDHYTAMQGGHFYSRRHIVFKLFEENIHVQCPACNQWGMKTTKIQEAYRIFMEDMYGARRIRAMQRLAWRASPKFNREEVIQFQRELKEKIGQELYRIGDI